MDLKTYYEAMDILNKLSDLVDYAIFQLDQMQ